MYIILLIKNVQKEMNELVLEFRSQYLRELKSNEVPSLIRNDQKVAQKSLKFSLLFFVSGLQA